MKHFPSADEPDGTKRGTSRRNVLKWAGAMSLPLVCGRFVSAAAQGAAGADAGKLEETVVQTCSTFDCGGKCIIKAHKRDGKIVRISARKDSELNPDMPIMRACVRGRGYRAFQYHPDRLKYPMKRVGKRG